MSKKLVSIITVIIFCFVLLSNGNAFAEEEKLSEGTKALYAIALVVLLVGLISLDNNNFNSDVDSFFSLDKIEKGFNFKLDFANPFSTDESFEKMSEFSSPKLTLNYTW